MIDLFAILLLLFGLVGSAALTLLLIMLAFSEGAVRRLSRLFTRLAKPKKKLR